MFNQSCRCCCPPNDLPSCGEVGDRVLRNPPDAPDFNELLWSSADDSVITRETLADGCSIDADAFANQSENHWLSSIDVTVDDPAVDWYALQLLWPDGVTINQLGWQYAIDGSASYAKPRLVLQAKRGADDEIGLKWGDSSPLIGMGLVLRTAGQPDAYSLPTWIRESSGSLTAVELTLPRCWTTFTQDCPQLVALDPAANADNRLDQWPFNDIRSRFDFNADAWVFGENPPFSDWPPSRETWQLGIYVLIASRPATYQDSSGNTISRPEDHVRRLDESFKLRLAIRSTCLWAAVVPHCQAWFGNLDELTLSVPDPATPDGPGYGPIEPLQWRGLETTLTLSEVTTPDESLYLDPRWPIDLHYQKAYVGEITDAVLTLGHRVLFVFVPCVSLSVIVIASNENCDAWIVIQPAASGTPTLANGGILHGTYREPPDIESLPQSDPAYYPQPNSVITVYEPQVDAPSYDPIRLAYRGRVVNHLVRLNATGNCESDACHPYDTGWSCAKTQLRRLGFTAEYEGSTIAGAFEPNSFWTWLEIRQPG